MKRKIGVFLDVDGVITLPDHGKHSIKIQI